MTGSQGRRALVHSSTFLTVVETGGKLFYSPSGGSVNVLTAGGGMDGSKVIQRELLISLGHGG